MQNSAKRKFIKGLSVILALLLMCSVFPLSVLAKTGGEEGEPSASDPTEEVLAGNAVREPYELTSKRTETAKYYQLPDGAQMVAVYGTAVHYQDEQGVWQDIDNYLAADGSAYQNAAARVKFAKKTTGSGVLFTLHEHNRKVTFTLDGAKKKVAGVVTNTAAEHDAGTTALQKLQTLDRLSSEILYSDLLAGVDLQYILTGNNIKENIIIKEQRESYSFSFTLKLNNLVAATDENGGIALFDSKTGELCYLIPAGYMTDAVGACSAAVSYGLFDRGNGSYTLTVSADAAWINAPARVFPVTVDPTVTKSSNAQDMTALGQNKVTISGGYNAVGNGYLTFWKLPQLPQIPTTVQLQSAAFSMTVAQCFAEYTTYFGVYNTDSWQTLYDLGHMSVSAQTLLASTPTDSVRIAVQSVSAGHYQSDQDYYTWNVLPIVQQWYGGQNNGLAIKEITETDDPIRFYSSQFDVEARRPVLSITYLDTKGLENYWSYSAQSAGLAGNGYVNNATGKLVFTISTLTTTDALMPFTPTLVYDGQLAGKEYCYPNAQMSHWGSDTPISFKLNSNETLLKTLDNMYIWSDADGTEHWFELAPNETTVYRDVDGLQLVLEETNSVNATITATNGTVRTFSAFAWNNNPYAAENTAGYYLTHVTDTSGNTLRIDLDGYTRPTSYSLIPNGGSAIQQMCVSYVGRRINAVWNPTAGEGVVFHYSATPAGTVSTTGEAYLRRMIRVHGTLNETALQSFYAGLYTASNGGIYVDAVAEYDYTASGRLSEARDLLSQYKIQYTYQNGKVASVTEYGANNTAGQTISFTYRTTATVIRNSGSDDVYGNSDDLLTTYVFDSSFRVINVYTTDIAYGKLYGASSGSYETDNPSAANKIKTAAQMTQQSSNYILNGGFEAGTAHWSGATVVAGSDGDDGKYAQYTLSPFNESELSQTVALYAGDYTLSFQFKAPAFSGIYFPVSVYQDNQEIDFDAACIDEGYVANTWMEFSLPFTVTGNGQQSITIFIWIYNYTEEETITVGIDNVMLAKTDSAAPFDLLQGGGFDLLTSASLQTLWSPSAADAQIVSCTEQPFRGDVLKIEHGTAAQTVPVSTCAAPDLYTVSGWAKGVSTVPNAQAAFAIKATVTYENDETDEFTFDFCKDTDDWQFLSGSFSVSSALRVVSIRVALQYTNYLGTAYFDSICLLKNAEDAAALSYDDRGNVFKRQIGTAETLYLYDANDDLQYVAYPNKTAVQYIYDVNRRVIRENHFSYTLCNPYNPTNIYTLFSGLVEKYYNVYTYNLYGLIIATQTLAEDNSISTITSTATYVTTAGSHIFGKSATVTDTLGKTTRYWYNNTNGRLESKEDLSCGYSYQYDALGAVTSCTSGNTTAIYTYDSKHMLSEIGTSNNTTYTFTRDAFGNITAVTAQDHTLAYYSYLPYNGKLQTMTYGNGLIVKYEYDALDRLAQILYNTGEGTDPFEPVCTYTYNAAGNVIEADGNSFCYDSHNRLANAHISCNGAYDNSVNLSFAYDTLDRLTNASFTLPYSVFTDDQYFATDFTDTTYTYSDTTGLLSDYAITGSHPYIDVSLTRDVLGRVTQREMTSMFGGDADGPAQTTQITYDNASRVSQWVNTVTYGSVPRSVATYNYVYNQTGSILVISDAYEVVQYRYEYDFLDQLTREDNRPLNRTYTYTYDYAGNRLSKTTYSFTLGLLGTPLDTETYTYDTQTWDDLLSETDTVQMVYDVIGNPTQIGNDVLTWQGRRLTSYTINNDETVTYTYNADGIRTSQSYGVLTRHYILDGTKILGEYWNEEGSECLVVYLYDENGAPIGLKYRDEWKTEDWFTTCLFEKNMLGDVVALYTEEGIKMCTYVYDAWGNCTCVCTSPAYYWLCNVLNPFRYRGYYYDVETGLYYLNSRYYNPQWGRFLNADGYINANGDLIGFNMFAYCSNNPIAFTDASGSSIKDIKNNIKSFWEDAKKVGRTSCRIIKEVTIQMTFEMIDFVIPNNNINSLQLGIAQSGCMGAYESSSVGIIVDRQGDAGVYITAGGGGSLGVGASVNATYAVSNAPSINDFRSLGFGMGGSVSAPIYGPITMGGGYDFSVLGDTGYTSSASSFNVGFGKLPAEFHAQMTYTWVVPIFRN